MASSAEHLQKRLEAEVRFANQLSALTFKIRELRHMAGQTGRTTLIGAVCAMERAHEAARRDAESAVKRTRSQLGKED